MLGGKRGKKEVKCWKIGWKEEKEENNEGRKEGVKKEEGR